MASPTKARRGDVMAILGDNDPHWFWAELAAQAAGGAVTGVFSSSGAKEVKYFLEHSDAKIVMAQGKVDLAPLLTHTFRLDDYRRALAMNMSKSCRKLRG